MARLGQRVVFEALELTEEEMTTLAIAQLSGITVGRIEQAFAKDSWPFDEEAQARWDRGVSEWENLSENLFLHTGAEKGRTVEEVLHGACDGDADVVFVDYLGMIGRRDARGRWIFDDSSVLGEAIGGLRALSRGECRYRIGYKPLVVALCQLNRKIEDGEDRPPRMSDFRGSALIDHWSDVVIGLRRRKRSPGDEGPVSQLDGYVLKNRRGVPDAVLIYEMHGATGCVTERLPK
jgi:replicative DNA helicase